ncbi:AsmA family protein [candidate division KSB1 bacterium]|nr:AsmA family protein [candidate division KSB1 bacterium]
MKRFAKILLAVLLVFILAVIGLTLYVKAKYPPERLKALLISYLADEYGVRAQIERLDFNLFSGFELNKIAIGGTSHDSMLAPEWGGFPLTVEKINFSYRWRSLLSRRLDIDDVTFEQPSFIYRQAPDSSSNLDAILAAFADTTATPGDTAAAGLPISIHLKTLRVNGLKINIILASVVDTQQVALGPLNLAVDQIEIDRQANFSGNIKLRCDPANLSYISTPIGQGATFRLLTRIQAEIGGEMHGDSVAAKIELAADNNGVYWGESNSVSPPRLSLRAEARYNLISAQLQTHDLHFSLAGQELIAARFAMAASDSITALELLVNRGVLDLGQLLALARTHTSGDIHIFLQGLACSGTLEFSGSELQSDQNGMRYQVALRGRDLAYADPASKLTFAEGQLRADWITNADSTMNLEAHLEFGTFDVPLDTQTVLPTGPGEMAINLALAKDFLPRRGELNLNWQNFSGGKLSGHAIIGPASNPPKRGSWLSRLPGEVEIRADSVELSTLMANAVNGKVNGKLALTGKRLDELKLTFDLHNAPLFYKTEEYDAKIPPYALSASAKTTIDPALTRFAFEDGLLQFKPDTARVPSTARFRANYEINKNAFRFDLTEAAINLAHVVNALPDTLFKGVEDPFKGMITMQIAGAANANGWLKAQLIGSDSLDYQGDFVLQTDNASYRDLALGLQAERLQIDSQWLVTAQTTTGLFNLVCPAPKMPDYLQQPVPRTTASGKMTIDGKTFTITEGKIDIPDWHAAGAYRVDGEFREKGMQVKTTVDLGLHAPETIVVDHGLSLSGDLQTRFVFDQYLPDALDEPQPARFVGQLQIDGLDVTVDTLLSLHDLKANCRFDQEFDLLDLTLKPSQEVPPVVFAEAGEALLMYDILGDVMRKGVMRDDVTRKGVMRENVSGPSRITIGQVNVLGYQISDVVADLAIGNRRLDIPKFSMKLFGGNLAGNLLVGLGSGHSDSISYSTSMQLASIDISYFRRLRAELGKGSRLSANFSLSGLGITPEKLEEVVNNLEGGLNITKIENKVASNLLQLLDPNGADKGIQNMRLLLKTRWNVRQITFEIKSGFIYASLEPVKPWFAPYSLPSTIDFARLPVRYFLQTPASE